MQKTKLSSDRDIEQRLNVFQRLFHTHYQSLAAYAYKIVDDIQDAEDIVQDVFMTLWVNKKTFDFNKPAGPYLFKAVYNRSINFLKSKKTNIETMEKQIDQLLHEEITQSYSDDSLLLKELSDEINRCIDALSPQCKKVFVLSRMSELKNREIAEALHISEKTVESHIGKALKELRTHLKKTGLMTFVIVSSIL
jgi:RNA polymerase sigma-70 factor (ECF subfamily)